MNEHTKPPQNEPVTVKKSSNTLKIIVGILIAIIVALAVWLVLTKSNLNTLLTEKENQRVELQSELDSLLTEHNSIKEEYGTLSDSLFVKDSIIQANAREIKKLLNTQWEYYKVKKKLRLLQKVAQGYVHQMDSLYRLNKELTNENIKIKREYQLELKKNVELTKVTGELTEKVEEASVLKTYKVTANAIRSRSGGKESITDKARRVNKIKICFTLSENAIIPAGNKEIYVRIARPDNKILTKGRGDEYSFIYQGEKLQYSIKKSIDYQNIAMDICLYWTKRQTQEMTTGLYKVEIFEGDNVIGHAKFSLRK
ncbi:MAG: hypothetical protein KAV70_06325 [Bacteroidales bacterium]|nr:hypothetical protein [Bacteroidales bacterium]